MSNTVFAWRNWCAEVGTISAFSSFYPATAPLTNLLTPRTSEIAIQTDGIPPLYGFDVMFDGYGDSPPVTRPVQIIALLNHNIFEVVNNGDFYFTVYSSTGTVNIDAGQMIFTTGPDFQSHVFLILPNELQADRVDVRFNRDVMFGRKDPYTGEVTYEHFQAGGIWAGPIWRPDRGIRFGSFTFGITEVKRGATSIGGQYYPLPQARRRRLSGDFTLTAESETFRLPESGFGLQQMAAWCGTSRPVICIPDITDPDLIYTQGIYGYFDSDLSWSHFDTSAKERQYRGSFSITEAL